MTYMAAAESSIRPIDVVLNAFHARGLKVRQSKPDQWEVQCPAHDDGTPSAGVNESPLGKVLMSCRTGCTAVEMAAALGIRMSDLFPDEPTRSGHTGNGLQERAVYTYTDAHGEVLYQVVRFVDQYGKKTFRQRRPVPTGWAWGRGDIPRVIYKLPQVNKAVREDREVWICEGEKDAENLQWHVDGVTTCNPEGAGSWRPEFNEPFRGARVHIMADDDTAGRGHADVVAIHLAGVALSVEVHLPAKGHNDISDHLKAGLGLDALRPISEPSEADDEEDEWSPRSTLVQTASEIRAGTRSKVLPDHLCVEGALPLLYRAKRNMVFGESGGGKSWLCLWAALEAARAGLRCAIIDYEDSEDSIAERLVALGATDEEIALIDYFNPTTGLGLGIEKFEERQTEYAHVWVDSAGEAMAAANVDPNVDPEVARWFVLLGRFTRLAGGPGATVLDHVPKANDAPSAYAIGSQRKRAAITGASYRVETLQEPAKGKSGKLKLIVAKDRGGNRAKGSVAAIVDLIASEDGTLRIELRAPAADEGATLRPADLMQRISEFVEQFASGVTAGAMKTNVKGNADAKLTARDLLVNEGYMALEKVGQGILHRSIKPYRKLMDPLLGPGAKGSAG